MPPTPPSEPKPSWRRLRAVAVLVLACSAAGQETLFEWTGDAVGDGFGQGLAAVGDVDLDGYPDVLVGAPGADRNGLDSGHAVVFSGRDGSILWDVHGPAAGARYGQRVVAAGDANRDAHRDFAVAGATTFELYDGRTGALLRALPVGDDAACAGDVDRDGHDDLIIGFFTGGTSGGGYALVLSGRDGQVLHRFDGRAAGDSFGVVAGGRDTNGDGYADLVVAAPNGGGFGAPYVHVYDGKSGRQLLQIGSGIFRFGHDVALVDDVDGDGAADVLVGAPDIGATCATGSAVLYSGRTGVVLRVVQGRTEPRCRTVVEQLVGDAVGNGGDLDGDGIGDLAIASLQRLRVVSAASGENLFVVPPAGTGFRGAFAAIGDVDRDGADDVAWSDPTGAGRVVVVSARRPPVVTEWHHGLLDGGSVRAGGSDGSRLVMAREGAIVFPPMPPAFEIRDRAGALVGRRVLGYPGQLRASLAPAGDVDQDQIGDWVVGWHSALGPAVSAVEVYSGRDARPLRTWPGPFGDAYGRAVAGGVDWNRDGVPDQAIGWPTGGPSGAGVVEIRSGADGSLLFAFGGSAAGDRYGAALAVAGDVDRDGVAELAVGVPGADRVELRSIAGGGVVWNHQGVAGSALGHAVAVAGDTDGDLAAEVIAGAPNADRALLLAGRDGLALQVFTGVAGSRFGHAVAGAADFDGDAVDDLVVAAPLAGAVAAGVAEVRIWSGRTGAVLWSERGHAAADELGDWLAVGAPPPGGTGPELWMGAARGGFGYEGDGGFFGAGYVRSSRPGRGRVSPFGDGCTGALGTPLLSGSVPASAGRYSLSVHAVDPSAPGALIIGISDRLHGGITLPWALSPLGAPGCALLVSIDAVLPLALGPHPAPLRVHYSVPSGWAGATLFQQYVQLDAVAAGGLALSNAVRITFAR